MSEEDKNDPDDESEETVRDSPEDTVEAEGTVKIEPGARPAASEGAAKKADETLDRSVVLTRYVMFPLNGPSRGKPFSVTMPQCMIGSSPTCEVVLSEAESVHAKIVSEGDGFALVNLGKPGSVILEGGRTVTKSALKSGDLAKIGGSVVRFARLGDVFPSQYDESAFQSSVVANLSDADFWKARRSWLAIAGLAVIALIVFLWPRTERPKVASASPQAKRSEEARAKEIASLLATGETLFQQGRLMPPPDRADEPNAFAKFNEVLALDPGNEKALSYLRKIDEKRDEARRAAAEEERRRVEAERAEREKRRRELAASVQKALDDGDKLFKAGQVADPPGRNALARYRDGLKIDPESDDAKQRIGKVGRYFIDRGDALRDHDDPWGALENYRRAARITEAPDPEAAGRVSDTESRLRSTMSASATRVVMYKDEKGRLFVVDEIDKVPARYRDRSVVVEPQQPK